MCAAVYANRRHVVLFEHEIRSGRGFLVEHLLLFQVEHALGALEVRAAQYGAQTFEQMFLLLQLDTGFILFLFKAILI